jgi:hypothetical protein
MKKVFNTRIDMISSLPKGLVVAELGVFEGEFSKIILDKCNPSELVLIDLWENVSIMSGDVDGNNIKRFNGLELYDNVLKLFENNDIVTIHRDNTTSALSRYPDNYFDMIYIDADHSYSGCKKDLEISYRKIKNGGYIMGHDYEQNFKKTKNVYKFGVNQAVNEFCELYNHEITMKGNDGCVSYAIKIKK